MQRELFAGSEFWRRFKPNPRPPYKRIRLRPKIQHLYSPNAGKLRGQLMLPFKPWRRGEPKPMLFQVQDFEGNFCDVYESRPTKHGFNLLFGYQTKEHHLVYCEGERHRLLLTPELVAYWQAHRTDVNANMDLPAVQATLSRLRKQLGFNLTADNREMWRQRLPDLQSLSDAEVAQKYNVSPDRAARWRRSILRGQKITSSKPIQPLAEKWRTPEVLAALRSEDKHRKVARTLGITHSHVAHLRRCLSVTPPEQIS